MQFLQLGHGQHLELPARSMQMPCALVPTKYLVLAVMQDGEACSFFFSNPR